MALNLIDEIVDDTPEDRIKKYREQIAELEEKYALKKVEAGKKRALPSRYPSMPEDNKKNAQTRAFFCYLLVPGRGVEPLLPP